MVVKWRKKVFFDAFVRIPKDSISPTHSRDGYAEGLCDLALTLAELEHLKYRDAIGYLGDLVGSEDVFEGSGEIVGCLDPPECIGDQFEGLRKLHTPLY